MVRRWGIVAVLALTLGGSAWAQDEDSSKNDAKRAEILNKLHTMKVSLDFRDTPLQDVIDFIREMSGINFVIDQKVNDELPPEKLKITIKVDELELRSALKLMLNMRGLTAVYRDGVLVVVTKASQAENTFMKIYDVRDLIRPIQDFPGPEIALQQGNQQGGQNGGAPTAAFNIPEEHQTITTEFIVDLIKKSAGGESWNNDKTSIQISNGLLVVVQSKEVHQEVERLINMLREYK